MKVHEALSEVMNEVRAVAKKDKNTQQGFNFRGIDAVVNAVSPALRKHGVIVLPTVVEHNLVGAQTSQGKSINVCRVKVEYTFYGPEGDSVAATVPGEAMDSGDKATSKAMSVAFRTALLQALSLPTDEADPDHDVYDAAQPARYGVEEARIAIRLAAGDEGVLRKAWSEAKSHGASPDVLDMIKTAATAAAPVEGKVV